MTDHILITELRIKAHVGVEPEERAVEQTLVINLDVATALDRPAESDELAETIDYGVLTAEVAEFVQATEARLLERLAGQVIDLIARNRPISAVTVEIHKEPPPLAEDVKRVGVRLQRTFE